jgi:putative IMPACT (imprinted ancient) family translation regulator
LDDEAALIQRVKERCSKEYDDNVEYRFMEALRNHVQHRGIPIHLARQHARWTGTGESRLMEFSVDIFALRSEMEDDHKFKKSVLTEMSERVDLKLATRSYLDSISAIHQFARDIVAPFVTGAREAIENVHERYEEIYTEGLVGISAFTMTDGEATSSIPLLLDWDDVRVSLQNRNCKLNLRKSCVSGRPAPNSP